MLPAATAITWSGSLLWLAIVAVAGFAVAYLITDRMGVRQGPYIGVLTAATAALAAGYTVWSGLGTDLWTSRWLWGCVGGIVIGAVLALLVNRLPLGDTHPERMTGERLAWQALVYGSAEGVLLSVLPVIVVWQAFAAAGWAGGAGVVLAGSAAFGAGVLVTVVHHLGYEGFRGGPRLRMAVIGCGMLSIAYLATGSVIAPVVGHILLHAGIMRRGVEMPPLTDAELSGRPVRLVRTTRAGVHG